MLTQILEGIKSFIGVSAPSGQETRDRARVLCRYPVNCALNPGDVPFRASVVDISRTGMRLEGVSKVHTGDTLYITLAQFPGSEPLPPGKDGPVQCEVMWHRKRPHDGMRLCGVRFLSPDSVRSSWVQSVLAEVGLAYDKEDEQRRKHIRLVTALRAELRDHATGQYLAEGKVANLSLGGVLVESEQYVKEGSDVLVMVAPYNNFPIFSVPGRVLSCRLDSDEGKNYISLQFMNVPKREFKVLKRYVFNLMKGRAVG